MINKRNVLNSPRLLELKKKRKRVILNKVVLSLSAIVAIVACLGYFSRLPNLNIKEIKVTGNKIVETKDIESLINEQLSQKYLWLIPKTNILIYPENKLETALSNKFKRLKDLRFSIENNKVLVLAVGERIPKYMWCGDELVEDDQETCYFLDNEGYIFDQAPYFSGEVYFKFYGKPEGEYFMPQQFKELVSFIDLLSGIGLKPAVLYLAPDQDINIFLSKGTGALSRPKILLKKNADLHNLAENLDTAVSTDPLMSELKTKYSKLEYIDLRFGNKIYYRFHE